MDSSTTSTQVWFVIDDSGSMGGYQAEVRQCVTALVKASGCDARFVCFSNGAQYSTDLASIRFAGGGTDICSGFSCLNQQMLMQLPLPSKVVVVFISDGEDNQQSTVNRRLQAQGGTIGLPNEKTVLFTVAVGNRFPTNMVVDALRPNYHNCSDYLPLVFPVDQPSDCKEAFQQLSNFMFEVDHDLNSAPQVDETSSQANLESAATAIYNYHVLRAAREQDKDKAVAELRAGKPELERITQIIQDRDDRLKGGLAAAKKVDVLKPLVSQRLAKYKQERASSLTVVQTLTQQLNRLITDAIEGKVLARLSDAELALALGYGNRAGRHLAKSIKYNSAEFSKTKSSLVQYLRGYSTEQAAADAQLADYIVTQEECITDAKERVDDIEASSINSIVSLVDVLAVIGRTLKVKTFDGTQINPWLVEVVDMPHVMKVMNSVDFFEVHKGCYQDPHRNEEANCLLPITSGPSSILREYVGQHLTTFFLARNEALCFSQSLGSLVAATLTHCLALPQPMPAWAKDEMAQALTTYECVYQSTAGKGPSSVGSKYLDRLASASEWHKCLVTEDPEDTSTKCEHLTKFILGLTLLVNQPATASAAAGGSSRMAARLGRSAFTSQLLRQYMLVAMAEMAGRAVDRSKDVTSYFSKVTFKQSAQELLSQVPMDDALQALTVSEATSLYQKAVSEAVTLSHPGVAISQTEDEMLASLSDLGVSHYQFNESVMSNIFENLNILAGNTAAAGFFRLTPTERLTILSHAHTYASSAERCNTAMEPYDINTLVKDLVSKHVRSVVAAAPERVTGVYVQRMREIHLGIMLHFPLTFTQRYQSDTGRDVEADLAINEETRLPRNCCVTMGCPCFLRRCSASQTPEGKPRMSDQLLNHLAHGGTGLTPAYTRCMLVNLGKDAREIAKKVLACEALLPCDEGTRTRAIKNMAGWWEGVQKLETFPTATNTLINMPSGPIDLAALVAADVKAFQEAEQLWGGYEAFKQALDERVYKTDAGVAEAREE